MNALSDFQHILAAARRTGDPAADRLVDLWMADSEYHLQLYRLLAPGKPAPSLNEFEQRLPGIEALTSSFRLPEWADPELLRAGSRLFTRQNATIMSLLGLMSLPYCYAAADGALVLYQSERMRHDVTGRLYNTAIFVWDTMAPGAFLPGGRGFSEVLKTRLTHAIVRYHTINQSWDMRLGYPVNQEDLAGTNLAFSLIVLRGLEKFGFRLNTIEAAGFMHLWRVIGQLLGIDAALLPDSPEGAAMLDAAIRGRHFRTSEHGVLLTASLVDHVYRVNGGKVSKGDIGALMRRLLDDEVADLIGLPLDVMAGRKWQMVRGLQFYKAAWLFGSDARRFERAYEKFKRAPVLRTR